MAGWDTRPVNSGYTVVVGTTTGNYNNGNPSVYVKTWMEYKVLQDSTDIANNRSRVDVKLYSQVITGGSGTGMANTFTANNYGYAGFDNSNRVYLSTTYDFNNFALNKFADTTLTIPHNADGTKTITLQGAFSTISGTWTITGGSASASITLPTIARGTELVNIDGLYYGYGSWWTLSRKASNLRERVTITNGGTTVTVKDTSNDSVNFGYTMPYSYTPNTAYPSASTWTINIYTYNGGTLVETKTYTKTWQIREEDKNTVYLPVFSWSVQAYNDVVSALSTDTAIAGYSKINVKAAKANVTTAYGATIASRVVTFQDGYQVSADQTDHISHLITTAGAYSFKIRVTDSRGIYNEVSGTYNVSSSSAPTINITECYRGNNDGTANPSGQYLWATATASCDSLNGHNSLSVRKVQAAGFSAVNFTNGTRVQLASTASASSTYTVTFTATDLLRTTTATRTIPAEDVLFNARKDGKGVGIGAYCEGEGLISVGYQFSGAIKSKGDRIFGTCNLIDMASLVNGVFDSSANIVYGNTTRLVTEAYAKVDASTTYTVSVLPNTIRFGDFACYNASKTYIGLVTAVTSNTESTYTFTTLANTKYVRGVLLKKNTSATLSPSEVTSLQLEKGSSASSYVPYAMDNVELTKRVTWKYRGEFVNTVSFDADDVELMIVPKAYGFTMQRAVYFISDLNTAQSPSNIVSAFQTATSYAWATFYRSGNSIILQDKQVGSSWSAGNVKFYVYTRK